MRTSDRFTVTRGADGCTYVKDGDPTALAREARALRLLDGADFAPRLIEHATGRLVTEALPGEPRELAELARDETRALGATLRQLHDRARRVRGGRHTWAGRATTLRAYGRRRLADIAPGAPAGLRRRVAAGFTLVEPDDPQPFRMLHGDLVAANIVWTPRPHLVDWEFWRTGDPAEDLAYLVAVNRLGAGWERDLLDGYRADPAIRARVAAWKDVTRLDAAAWYAAHGHHDLAVELTADIESA